ncbi:hypothetical protein D9M68_718590 [compost metagenome]
MHGGIGPLFEGQGDIEAQAVFQSGAFMGGRHDAAASTGNHHQLVSRQGGTQFAGQGIQGVIGWRACRTEYGDLASPFELLQ